MSTLITSCVLVISPRERRTFHSQVSCMICKGIFPIQITAHGGSPTLRGKSSRLTPAGCMMTESVERSVNTITCLSQSVSQRLLLVTLNEWDLPLWAFELHVWHDLNRFEVKCELRPSSLMAGLILVEE